MNVLPLTLRRHSSLSDRTPLPSESSVYSDLSVHLASYRLAGAGTARYWRSQPCSPVGNVADISGVCVAFRDSPAPLIRFPSFSNSCASIGLTASGTRLNFDSFDAYTPSRVSATPMVRHRIFRSSQIIALSMYHTSQAIRSVHARCAPPLTCCQPVIPGGNASRCLSLSV
jgi:hypothetical protein